MQLYWRKSTLVKFTNGKLSDLNRLK